MVGGLTMAPPLRQLPAEEAAETLNIDPRNDVLEASGDLLGGSWAPDGSWGALEAVLRALWAERRN